MRGVIIAWPDLLERLGENRFDLAMSGVTVAPGRSVAGRFSVPVANSGAVVLFREPERFRSLDEVDRIGIRIGVNFGGHLQRVAEVRFSRATIVAIRDNLAVPEALFDGRLDAAVTDTFEVREWQKEGETGGVLGPFTRDRKAYLLRSDRAALAADLDAWLLAREADGTLSELRRQHLGKKAQPPTATPLAALLAAVDERLALMPLVGAAKRAAGLPLVVYEREAFVLDAAVDGVRAAAARAETTAPPSAEVRAFFRKQIEAAREVQRIAVRDPEFSPAQPLPDLDEALRPALMRIGERIASLVVALPDGLDAGAVRREAEASIRTPRVSTGSIRAIADTIAALSQARETARANSPASTGSTRQTP